MARQEPYDAGNPEHVRKAKLSASTDKDRMQRGLAKIVNDADCRFVLQQFMQQAGPFRDAFTPDPYSHAHNAGWKSAAFWWLNTGLLHDPQFMSKIQTDDGSQAIVRHDDGPDDNHDGGSD